MSDTPEMDCSQCYAYEKKIEECFNNCKKKFKSIHGLINNAIKTVTVNYLWFDMKILAL